MTAAMSDLAVDLDVIQRRIEGSRSNGKDVVLVEHATMERIIRALHGGEKLPVTFHYDGAAVTPEHVAAVRETIITLRNMALEQTEFGFAVNLSHAIATIAKMAEHIWGDAWKPTLPGENAAAVELPFPPLVQHFREGLEEAVRVCRPFAKIKPPVFEDENIPNAAYTVVRSSHSAVLGRGVDFTKADLKVLQDFVTWFDNGMNNPTNDGGFKLAE
jgi:hypothetical protein